PGVGPAQRRLRPGAGRQGAPSRARAGHSAPGRPLEKARLFDRLLDRRRYRSRGPALRERRLLHHHQPPRSNASALALKPKRTTEARRTRRNAFFLKKISVPSVHPWCAVLFLEPEAELRGGAPQPHVV